jgi:hypothetical protein
METISHHAAERHQLHPIHVNFKIPSEVHDVLEKVTMEDKISLNALVNQILSKYVSFERAMVDEPVVVPKQLFAELVSTFPEEQAKAVGTFLGAKLRRDFAFHRINQDSEAILNFHLRQMGTYSGWYDLEVSRTDARIRAALLHEYGQIWSAFLTKYYQSAIRAVTGAEPRTEQEGGTLVITF